MRCLSHQEALGEVFVLFRTVEHSVHPSIPAVHVLVIPVFQCAAMNYDLKLSLRVKVNTAVENEAFYPAESYRQKSAPYNTLVE